MNNQIIKNFEELASNNERRLALQIAEAGLQAINTRLTIENHMKFNNSMLQIREQIFNLSKFKRIYVIGFGKASCDAILALNDLLKDKISSGIAIDVRTRPCDNPNIKIYKGSHPKPSVDNLIATREILELSENITKDDLVLCIVSGGGSALLCASEEECNLDSLIYDEFLKSGGNINELNTLRKHVSALKGGFLAKKFYPATIISLIFSDIPGGGAENVASGPTFLDATTIADAKDIINKYKLKGLSKMEFLETPKEQRYFENVYNILLVSNHQAVEAMYEKAKDLNLNPEVYSETILDKIDKVAHELNTELQQGQVRISGGEPAIVAYKGSFGKGGRNTQLALESLPYLKKGQVFISIASDGLDNSEIAGAIVDSRSPEKLKADFNLEEQRLNLDSFRVFEKSGDLIKTGPTGSNVADLMVSLRI